MSTTTALADAIVASLNSHGFTQTVSAVRSHIAVFDLDAVGDALQVSVVPRSVEQTAASRGSTFFDVSIDIGVQKRIDPNDPSQIDSLITLAEEIGDQLRMAPLAVFPKAQWISSEINPVLAADHLQQLNVFTSVLTITYRVTR